LGEHRALLALLLGLLAGELLDLLRVAHDHERPDRHREHPAADGERHHLAIEDEGALLGRQEVAVDARHPYSTRQHPPTAGVITFLTSSGSSLPAESTIDTIWEPFLM